MPWPAGMCPLWPMDPREQPLRLPGSPHPPAPTALSLPGALCFLPLSPAVFSLHSSFTRSLFGPLPPLFLLFSFFLFFLLFLFCSSMSLFLLFSYFLHFPIFLLFLFLSSFSFLFNSFSPPFYFPLFFLSFFSRLSLCFSFRFPPLAFPLLCFLSRGHRRVAPAAGEDGASRDVAAMEHQRAPGAPGVGGPGPVPPSCLLEPAQLSLIPGGRSNGLGVQGGRRSGTHVTG